METAELLLLVLVATAGFGLLARRLRIPDAIVLVLAGLGLGFVPGLPRPELSSEVVFLVVLPPLLYSQAWFTSWDEFWQWRRAIFLLAVGLVLFTTFVVALVLHALEPSIPFAICCAFGAIVSPPDAVAASAIAQAFRLPKRLVTILEGESLVNDATGLVAFRFALAAAAAGGHFSLGGAALNFLLVAGGGVGLGLASGWFFAKLLRPVRDDAIEIAISLVAPYATYLLAERLHLSGVLAVVTAGIWLGARGSEVLTANARLRGFAFWTTLVFLLNGAVFLLIGLQLPRVAAGASSLESGSARLIAVAAAVFATTVVVRIAWVYPGAYVPRLLSRRIREREPRPRWQHVAILGWAGMRGVVSLAAALSLPVDVSARPLLVFLTFAVILGTLVVQGLSLPWLIRLLGVGRSEEDDGHEAEAERAVRITIATAALQHLRERAEPVEPEALLLVVSEYEDRLRRLHAGQASLIGEPGGHARALGSVQLRREGLAVERRTLLDRHRRREVPKELLVRLERELDMDETRLLASDGSG
jgi:CPA1 family monovalent cation:H+ antiporter